MIYEHKGTVRQKRTVAKTLREEKRHKVFQDAKEYMTIREELN